MTPRISIHEASHRLHKTDAETFELLKAGAFAGNPNPPFPTVDSISLDQYILNNRDPKQRTILDDRLEYVPACELWEKTAWDPVLEESVVKDCLTGAAAIAAYRAAFPRSTRTDKAITNHWSKLRHPVPQPRKGATKGTKGHWYDPILRALGFGRTNGGTT